ncbi:MAG: hypothetical protein E7Z96_02365 [Actinomycetaceae bacterium]|nr:hypothetical protein [Actinomycetaceae bacterium]
MSSEVWASALQTLMQPSVLLFLCAGVVIGTIIGALPGLSATMAIAIMTPITFWFSPTEGFAMLMGLWNAAIFAGGISAILVNTPGTPASITQSFDGYPLYRRGQGGMALGVNVIFSVLGGVVSVIALILFASPIARFTVTFGPSEYCLLAVFGLAMMIAVASDDVLKGLVVGVAGLLVACIGLDPILSVKRFTMGQTSLLAGVSFIPVMIGIFGIGEVLYQIHIRNRAREAEELVERKRNLKLGRVLPPVKETLGLVPRTTVAAGASTIIGAIPAAGGDIASIICWGNSKKLSKHGDEYGKGSVEGLAVSSAANNGVIGGAMTTMLTLGIPGDAVTAILIGSLTMYGMQPGYKMFSENADFTAQVMLLMLLANLVMLVFGLATAKASARALNVSQSTVWVAVCGLCVVGSYSLNNNFFDVILMFIAGVLGYLFKAHGFPPGPFILGLLLGSMFESNLRRALVMSNGSYSIFVTRPVSLVLVILVALTFVVPLLRSLQKRSRSSRLSVQTKETVQ